MIYMEQHEASTGQEGMKVCCRMHWCCCTLPLLSGLFWLLALVALVFGWVAWQDVFLGWGAQWWFWNALILGVLSLYGRGKSLGACKGGHCGSCGGNCENGSCKMK